MRVTAGLLLVAAAACGGPGTDPDESAAEVITGAAYELIAVDGHALPWPVVVPARVGTTTMTVARGTLAFRSSLAPEDYEFALIDASDPDGPGTRLIGGWRQNQDGWVELVGGGTTDAGQQVALIEGRGRPIRGTLLLTTTVGFWFAAHDWQWRRIQ